MFLKSLQPPIIDKCPYYHVDLQKDYPDTSFPIDFLSENNPELIDYHVYFIYEDTTELPENYVITNRYPSYANDLNRFEWFYETREKTLEEIRQEKFNPINFLENLSDNLLFQQWSNTCMINPSFSFMMVAFQNNKYDRVQNYYNYLKLHFPIPENAQSQWQEIAEDNGIDLIF